MEGESTQGSIHQEEEEEEEETGEPATNLAMLLLNARTLADEHHNYVEPDLPGDNQTEFTEYRANQQAKYKVIRDLVLVKCEAEAPKAKDKIIPKSMTRILPKPVKVDTTLPEAELVKETFKKVNQTVTLSGPKDDPHRTKWNKPKEPRKPFKSIRHLPKCPQAYDIHDAVRPTKLLPLDGNFSDIGGKSNIDKLPATTQVKRLETWETTTATTLNMVNHLEWFSAGIVKTMEELYDIRKTDQFLPKLLELATMTQSRARTIEDITENLQWVQADIIAARRDVYLNTLPFYMSTDIKEALRHLPTGNKSLFNGEITEAYKKITEIRKDLASIKMYEHITRKEQTPNPKKRPRTDLDSGNNKKKKIFKDKPQSWNQSTTSFQNNSGTKDNSNYQDPQPFREGKEDHHASSSYQNAGRGRGGKPRGGGGGRGGKQFQRRR